MAARLKLGRPLELHENEMFLFPRVCEICGDAEPSKIMDCCKCHSVFYCSDEHRSVDVERHKRWCDIYDLCIDCDVMEYRMGVESIPFPMCIDAKYKALPATIKEYFQSLLGFLSSYPSFEKKLLITLMSERLTYPLSLLYALEQVKIGPCKKDVSQISELTVHVVGAESTKEMLGIIRWEYLAHTLPTLQKLHVVFIGPKVFSEYELSEALPDNHCLDDSGMTRCQDCQEKGKVIMYEMCQMLYHSYAHTTYYTNPDAIISFNCGFHEFQGEEQDTWPESLRVMVQSKDVPLIFTSYTKRESVNDFEVLEKMSEVEVIMAKQLNPYQSLRPHRDPVKEDDADIFYFNQYIACVRGKK